MATGKTSMIREVVAYTDGACIGNPGPGGYGVILECEGRTKQISGGFRNTTNNRMEIMAAIAALEALKEKCRVEIFSDSKYLVRAMEDGWVKKWKSNNWKRNRKDKAINIDLWERLTSLCELHEVRFAWVRSHSGIGRNDRCDRLAVEAANKPRLPPDTGYEPPPTTQSGKLL